MISKLRLLERYLNLLLVALIPTQLAIHFWPSFSLIYGIRVDYLAPTIYLTDILFITLFIFWAVKSRSEILDSLKKNRIFLVIFLSVAIINTFTSISFAASLLKWLKIVELIAFCFYIKSRGDVFNLNNIAKVLFASSVFISVVGLMQFLRGSTFANYFYLIGERSFSIFTPGIALTNILGKNYLRIYSTFPHPNSLAGFLGVSTIFLIVNKPKNINVVLPILSSVLILTFILTFSLSAFVGIFVCIIFYFLFNKYIFNKSVWTFLINFVLFLSLMFALFSKPLLNSGIHYPNSFRERFELANISGNIFSTNWLVGTGLNTFIQKETLFASVENNVWLLQPVHNIYLLIFAETGVLGITLMCFILYKLTSNIIKKQNTWEVLAITFILITSLFDHYWFTSQQNMFVASLIFGVSLRHKVSYL